MGNTCVLCGEDNFSVELRAQNPDRGDIHTIVRCRSCSLRQMFLPESFDLTPYYEETRYYAQTSSLFNRVKLFLGGYLKRRQFDQILPKDATILDLGCGDGAVLDLFRHNQWKLYGIEPHGKPAPREGMDISHRAFEETTFPDHFFDLVMLWHVLEHISDPRKVLHEIGRILKPSGFLFLSVPNSGSLGFQLFGRFWFALYPPIHLQHFDLPTITRMLHEAGFSIRGVQRFPAEYDPFVLLQSILNWLRLTPQNFFYKWLRGTAPHGFWLRVLTCISILGVFPFWMLLCVLEWFLGSSRSEVLSIIAYPRGRV